MPKTSIRPLAPGDFPAWRALWIGYLEFYETRLPDPVHQTAFARLIGDDPQDFSGLIAVRDGAPVGLAHYLFHRHGWKIENVCYLQDLFVAPEARGLGLGRALIEAVYAAADAAGAPQVYWLTQDFNTGARQLYDRIGQVTPFIRYVRR
jgi:GNAT superfamily N-acetyltransferase